MTPADLRRLAEAATDRDWVVLADNPWQVRLAATNSLCGQTVFEINCETPEDAAYIVAACNALPSLLDDNEALRARLDEAVFWLEKHTEDCPNECEAVRFLVKKRRAAHDAQPPPLQTDTEATDG